VVQQETRNDPPRSGEAPLARRLGAFDATMIVMGGIIGSGIFINPYVVARHLHSVPLILAAWLTGGVIALLGAFVYAELGARRPEAGGQYAYLRDAYHPAAAFMYGWGLLLVVESGGMAAVAVTFARYFIEVTHIHLPDSLLATLTLVALTAINCFGVRAGSNTQTALMLRRPTLLPRCGRRWRAAPDEGSAWLHPRARTWRPHPPSAPSPAPRERDGASSTSA
jgi:APA family basic amino acid/polyamine antiporter